MSSFAFARLSTLFGTMPGLSPSKTAWVSFDFQLLIAKVALTYRTYTTYMNVIMLGVTGYVKRNQWETRP
jgi:hypothetical protein